MLFAGLAAQGKTQSIRPSNILSLIPANPCHAFMRVIFPFYSGFRMCSISFMIQNTSPLSNRITTIPIKRIPRISIINQRWVILRKLKGTVYENLKNIMSWKAACKGGRSSGWDWGVSYRAWFDAAPGRLRQRSEQPMPNNRSVTCNYVRYHCASHPTLFTYGFVYILIISEYRISIL